jgi:hypothetical protein
MTRSVPRTVRRQWIDFVAKAGADEETATNVGAMIAGDPRLSFAEVDSPEDAREVIETAAFLIEQFDLTDLGLTDEQDQRVKAAMLVAHRYGLVDEAPLEAVHGDPSAHALSELPTIGRLLRSDDPTIQEMGLTVLDELSDETLAEAVTEPVAARIEDLRGAPVTSVATLATSVDDQIASTGQPVSNRGNGFQSPPSRLLSNLREREERPGSTEDERDEDDSVGSEGQDERANDTPTADETEQNSSDNEDEGERAN